MSSAKDVDTVYEAPGRSLLGTFVVYSTSNTQARDFVIVELERGRRAMRAV